MRKVDVQAKVPKETPEFSLPLLIVPLEPQVTHPGRNIRAPFFLFIFLKFHLFVWERERERAQWEGQRERGEQTPRCRGSPTPCSIHDTEIMPGAETKSQKLN